MKTKFFYLLMFCSLGASAQSNTDNHTVTIVVNSIAILDLELAAGKNISMTFGSPTDAGLPLPAPAANNAVWLNYTSVLPASGVTSRKITVAMTGGTLTGVQLSVQAGAIAGTGGGDTGDAEGSPIVLDASEQDIVTGIGSAYTGTGNTNGHQLTYNASLVTANFGDLKAGNQVVTVTYTFAEG
jgi:hypothetical protein